MVKYLRFAILLPLVAVTAACGTKTSTVRPHDGARAETTRTQEEHVPKAADLTAASLTALEQKSGATGHAQALDVINMAGPALLDSGLLDDSSRFQTEYARRLLTVFNRAAIAVARSDQEFLASAQGWMAKWESALLKGCDADFKGCRSVAFFRTDSNSADLALLRARTRATNIEKFRLLRVAFDVSGSQRPAGLEREFAASAPAFLLELRKDGIEKNKTEINRLENIVETSLLKADNDERAKIFASISSAFPIWSLSMKSEPPLGRRVGELMFRFGAATATDAAGTINPGLKKVLDERSAAEGSVEKDLERLRAKLGNRLDSLGLPASVPRDAYLYIVSSVFEEHLSPDEAALVWGGIRQPDRIQMIARVRDYVRVRVLALLHDSNVHMKNYLGQTETFSTGTMLTKALTESLVLTSRWDSLFSRVDALRTFTQKILFDARKADPLAEELFNDFRGLRRNVKYFAVWPTMFLISYHLSKADFKITFETFWGAVTIDSGYILKDLIEGRMDARLNFGNDGAGLSQAEVAYALSYAVAAGVFEDYGVSQKDFFAEFLRRYLGATDTNIRRNHERLLSEVSRDQDFRIFQELCQSTESTRPQQIRLEDFLNYTYHGSGQPNMSSPILGAIGRLYGVGVRGEGAGIDMVEEVTLILEPRLHRAKGFLEILKPYVKDAAEARAMESELEKYRDAKRLFLAEYTRLVRISAPCHQKMVRREFERQNKLLLAEAEYMRHVHRRMKAARALTGAARAEAEQSMNADLRLLPSYVDPKQLRALSRIDADHVQLNRLDGLLRMASYLERGWPAAKITPVGPQTRILVPANPFDPTLDLATRSVSLPFLENEDEFVGQALRFWTIGDMTFVSWRTMTVNFQFSAMRWWLMAAIYKTGGFEAYDSAKDESGRLKLKLERLTAAELLDEVERTADLAALSETEEKIARMLGESSRFSRPALSGTIIPNDSSYRFGLADGFADLVLKPVNGFPVDGVDDNGRPFNQKYDVMDWGQKFYKEQRAIGRLYLPIDDKVKRAVAEIYRPLVQNQLRAWKELIDESARRSKPGATQVRYHLRNEPIGDPSGWISAGSTEDVRSQIAEIHKNTQGFFAEKPSAATDSSPNKAKN